MWWLIGIGAVVLVLVIGVNVANNVGSVPAGDPNAADAGPAVDQNETCAREVYAEAVLLYAEPNAGYGALINAIGAQNPQYQLAERVVGAMVQQVPRVGVSDAAPVVRQDAASYCNPNNPVLDAGQLASLKQLIPQATNLNDITIFG